MGLGDTLKQLLADYAEGRRIETLGPGYRERQAVLAEQARQAPIATQAKTAELSNLLAEYKKKRRLEGVMAEAVKSGRVPALFEADPRAAAWVEGAPGRARAERLGQMEEQEATDRYAVRPTGEELLAQRGLETRLGEAQIGQAEASAAASRARAERYAAGPPARRTAGGSPRYTGQAVSGDAIAQAQADAQESLGIEKVLTVKDQQRVARNAKVILFANGWTPDALRKAGMDVDAIDEAAFMTTRGGGRAVDATVPVATEENSGGLQPGVVEDGWKYLGGDPADPQSWEPAE